MADMSMGDFAAMVEETAVHTHIVEYRFSDGPKRGALAGAALVDALGDGLSMVYSFFEPSQASRSLGTFMILDHITKTRAFGLPYLYLGYWVEGSKKMAYKGRFLPQERLGLMAWERVDR